MNLKYIFVFYLLLHISNAYSEGMSGNSVISNSSDEKLELTIKYNHSVLDTIINSSSKKRFKDKLIYGGNIGVSANSIELSPLLGYRITPEFIVGFGLSYYYLFHLLFFCYLKAQKIFYIECSYLCHQYPGIPRTRP